MKIAKRSLSAVQIKKLRRMLKNFDEWNNAKHKAKGYRICEEFKMGWEGVRAFNYLFLRKKGDSVKKAFALVAPNGDVFEKLYFYNSKKAQDYVFIGTVYFSDRPEAQGTGKWRVEERPIDPKKDYLLIGGGKSLIRYKQE